MSQVLVVALDLVSPGQNLEAAVAKIKAYGQWARLSTNTYLVYTSHSVVDVRNWVQGALFQNDKVYVGLLGHNAAWNGYPETFSGWVRARQ